jgi:glucose uptake protein
MFIVNSYSLAVVLCIVTMLCWGSWGNTQKLAGKTWRYELFYWDYVIGILLFSVILGLTLGNHGEAGRGFITDLGQLEFATVLSAFVGGVIFNGSNILLSASVSLSGLSVAFPVGVGLALVLGVFVNYFGTPKGDPFLLFLGVAFVVAALIFNGIAASKNESGQQQKSKKGIWLAIVAGVLMSLFYRFVTAAMDMNNFECPEAGKATPYTAFFIFSVGVFVSNFLFNTILMKKPINGTPVSYGEYFSGSFKTHCVGLLGGIVWALGTSLSYIAAGKAGAAISYALGQGAPMIAAFWGVFIWKEFKGSKKTVDILLALMFVLFILGLSLIVVSGGN